MLILILLIAGCLVALCETHRVNRWYTFLLVLNWLLYLCFSGPYLLPRGTFAVLLGIGGGLLLCFLTWHILKSSSTIAAARSDLNKGEYDDVR